MYNIKSTCLGHTARQLLHPKTTPDLFDVILNLWQAEKSLSLALSRSSQDSARVLCPISSGDRSADRAERELDRREDEEKSFLHGQPPMKFYLDEDLSPKIAQILRKSSICRAADCLNNAWL
jgi:hypothetical protein